MRRSGLITRLAALSVVILVAVSCSRNPEVAKREYLEKGNAYFAQKKYAEAIIEYRNAVQVDPKFGEARRRLADAYLQTGDAPNGYREYVRAADLMPDDTEVQLTAGGLRLVARQYEDAKGVADRVLAREPKNLRALVLRANAIAGLNNLEQAVGQIEEALKIDPSSELYTNLGGLELKRERFQEAEEAFRQAVQADPKSVRAHSAFGSFYWATNRRAEAEAQFKRAVELQPTDPLANRTLALYYLTSNRLADAEKPLQVISQTAGDVNARLALADYYLLARRTAEGIKVLDEAAKTKDGAVPAKTRLAAIAYMQGRRDEAHRIVDGILSTNGSDAQALLVKARFLFLEQKLEEAAQRAKEATTSNPRSAQGFYLLGEIYAAQGKVDDATRAFGEVLRLNPRAAAATIQLSRIQLAAGDEEAAVRLAEQSVQSAPGASDTHYALARALLARGDLARADTELALLERRYPNSATLDTLRGYLHIQKKEYSKARQAYDRAQRHDNNSIHAVTGLVALDLLDKKPDAARARAEARLAQAPGSPAALLLAAKTYGAVHDLPKAEESLRKIIQLNPADILAYGMLGQLYYAQRRVGDAIAQFEALVQREPTSVPGHTMLAILLGRQGRIEEAKLRYQRVLAIDPRAAVAANNLAWLYAEKGENLDGALQLAQTAYAQEPDRPQVCDTLGWVYQKKGLPKLAIPPLRQAVDKDPGNPAYPYHLGVAYASAGERDAAREALERSLTVSSSGPDAEQARRLLATLK